MDLATLQIPPWVIAGAKALWASLPEATKDAMVAAVLREARAIGDAALNGLGRIALHAAIGYARARLAGGAPADLFPDLAAFPDWSIANGEPNQEPPPEGA